MISQFREFLGQQHFRLPRQREPMIIELLGPAGAGKTTFLRQIRRGRPRPTFWATRAEIGRKIRFLRTGRKGLDDRLLGILHRKIDNVRPRVGTENGLRHLRNAFDCLQTVNLESGDLPCHLVEDEGFFYAFRRELVESANSEPHYFRELVRSRGFVFLRGNPDTIVANLRRRTAEGGKTHPLHVGISDETLLSGVRQDNALIETLVALAREEGRPVLEIAPLRSDAANRAAFEAMFD